MLVQIYPSTDFAGMNRAEYRRRRIRLSIPAKFSFQGLLETALLATRAYFFLQLMLLGTGDSEEDLRPQLSLTSFTKAVISATMVARCSQSKPGREAFLQTAWRSRGIRPSTTSNQSHAQTERWQEYAVSLKRRTVASWPHGVYSWTWKEKLEITRARSIITRTPHGVSSHRSGHRHSAVWQ
jgi:hypothetical protein